ncbi:MAG: hypothetical protein ACOCQU_00505 [Halolamina sp.]
MFDCTDVADELAASDDPRLDGTYLRCLPERDDRHTVVLVGVVHDHPASVTRVVRLLESLDPATLAVELPPLAMPLFRLYADDDSHPPRLGGEMSAAIQAVDGETVGIDAPSVTYLRHLLGLIRRERPSLRVIGRLLKDLGTASTQALVSRAAGLVAAHTPVRPRVYTPIRHECSLVDTAAVQAGDERAYLDRRDALFRAIRPPESTRLIDDARDAAMGSLLDRERRSGTVVAVVGMEHLDAVAAALQRLAGGPAASVELD